MTQLIEKIPQRVPIVHRLEGKVEIGNKYTVGGISIPKFLENKFLRRCKGYETVQEAVNNKELYLRGRENAGKLEWFALTTNKFKPIPVNKISELMKEISDEMTVRYMPERERFQVTCKLTDVPQKLSLLIDSGDFGVYGGNAEYAIKCGLSMFDRICTNWTLFLQNNEKINGRSIHRHDEPDLQEIINTQLEFADVLQGKWNGSRTVVYDKGVLEAYAEAYVKKSGNQRFFERVLEGMGNQVSGYNLAYRITEEAQNLSNASRLKMEMLAGELILCPEQINRWYDNRLINLN